MDGHLNHDTNLNELRARISASAYTVDPVAVADAIVRRRSLAVASAPRSRAHRLTRIRARCIPRREVPRRADALRA